MDPGMGAGVPARPYDFVPITRAARDNIGGQSDDVNGPDFSSRYDPAGRYNQAIVMGGL